MVHCFYEDTIDNVLYVGGSFRTANNDTVSGIFKWNGSEITQLGFGFDYQMGSFPSPVNSIIRFNNEIYASGFFSKADSIQVNSIAKWDGSNWLSIGTGITHQYGAGVGWSYRIIDNELYLCGGFDSINEIPAHGLCKYNGTVWSAVYDFPLVNTQGNAVDDVAIYNGELYVGGNLDNSSLGINSLMKWDGSNWIAIPGIYGGMAAIVKMCVYKDELYVAGTFSKSDSPDNPGNYIARWDGTSWSDVGGDVWGFYSSSNAQIHDMKVHNNMLYIVGVFQIAGGIEAQHIACWDGNTWCGLGSNFNNVLTAVGFLNDTLYIGGAFISIDGDSSYNYIAKWTGGNYTSACGNNSGYEEIDYNNVLQVCPNPVCSSAKILCPNPINDATLSIFDINGREVSQISDLSGKEITFNRGLLPQGLYYFILFDEGVVIGSGKFQAD